MTDPSPRPGLPYLIPEDGSLGLLALGYRGLVAWRAERGSDWIDQRRSQFEATEAEAAASPDGAPEKAETVADRPGVMQATQDALDASSVVVVCGLPRSGTSMLMQMLVAGGLPPFTDAEREADASNPKGYFEHERVKALAMDQGWVPDADGHVVKVVAPLLPHLPAGPTYRVIMLQRDLDEILASQAAMLARLGRPSADAALLRPIFERHLDAAHAWLSATPDTEALVLEHRRLIESPQEQASRLKAFLGEHLDAAAMAAVVDPSLHRQRTD